MSRSLHPELWGSWQSGQAGEHTIPNKQLQRVPAMGEWLEHRGQGCVMGSRQRSWPLEVSCWLSEQKPNDKMGPPVREVGWKREEQVSPDGGDVSGRKEKHFVNRSTESLSHPRLYLSI